MVYVRMTTGPQGRREGGGAQGGGGFGFYGGPSA